MQDFIDHIRSLDWTALVTVWGSRILLAIVVFAIGRLLAKLIGRLIGRIATRAKFDETLVRFLTSLTVIALTVVAAIFAVDQLGVDTTSLIAVLGAAGLAIGLALKDSLANFASSVMIMTFKPFKPGDFVEAGGASGTVLDIGMFNTRMLTADNQYVVVPNSQITNDKTVNYSHEPLRRLSFEIGISYNNDIDAARKAILEVIAEDERIKTDPAPSVQTWSFGDSSVNLMLYAWMDTAEFWNVRSDLLERIKANFDARGISIPFPQREIRYYKDL
ncbi:MAG TPA: mechanosensitive ion channel domain-containing protein [Gammaproteobacteria bacterium]